MKKWIAGAAVALGAGLVSAAPARADITSGSCEATIRGNDSHDPPKTPVHDIPVRGRSASDLPAAIEVNAHSKVLVRTTSNATIETYRIDMTYAGFTWTVATGTANSNSWEREVDVDKYAKFGTGYYRVTGVSTGPGACSGAALVKIIGRNPLTTVAGAGSAILAGAALAGVGLAARGAGKKVLRPGIDHSREYRIFEEGARPSDRVTAIVDTFNSATSPSDYTEAIICYANAGARPDEVAIICRMGEPVQQHITALCLGG